MSRQTTFTVASYGMFLALVLALLAPGFRHLPQLLSVQGFDPHGHCFLWNPSILRLYVISDSLIGVSYLSISFILVWLVYRTRHDLPFYYVFLAFGAFIVTCGLTHFMDIWTLWNPTYWLSGYTKFITAIASTGTAIMLPSIMPRVIRLIQNAKLSEQRKHQLIATNEALQAEIAQHARALEALRASESRLRLALERERELNEMRARAISTISHELRTPLTIINSSVNLLVTYGARLSAEGQQTKVARIHSAINNITQMLDDALTLRHVQEHSQDFRPDLIDLEALCRVALEDVEGLASDRHNLELDVVTTCPQALVDPGLMRRAVSNLLTNAIKYSPEGGTVRVALLCLGSDVLIQVSDQGIGIPPDARAHLFETFYRASNAAEFKGMGLGLAIAHHAVSRHDGTIEVESELGKGTTFTIRLPLRTG